MFYIFLVSNLIENLQPVQDSRANMFVHGALSLLGYNQFEYKFSTVPQTYGMTTPMKNSIMLKDSRNEKADDKGRYIHYV